MSAPKVDVMAEETKCPKSDKDAAVMLGAREFSLEEARKTDFSLRSIANLTAIVYVVAGNGPRANRYFRAKGEIVYQPGQATPYPSHFHATKALRDGEEVFEYNPVSGELTRIEGAK